MDYLVLFTYSHKNISRKKVATVQNHSDFCSI